MKMTESRWRLLELCLVPTIVMGAVCVSAAAQSVSFEPNRIFRGIGMNRFDTYAAAERDFVATAFSGLAVRADGTWACFLGNGYPYGESTIPPVPWSSIAKINPGAALLNDGSLLRWDGWGWGGNLPADTRYTDFVFDGNGMTAIREDGIIASTYPWFQAPPLPAGTRYLRIERGWVAERSDGVLLWFSGDGAQVAQRHLPSGVHVVQLASRVALCSDGVIRSTPFLGGANAFEVSPPPGDPFVRVSDASFGGRIFAALTRSGAVQVRLLADPSRVLPLPAGGSFDSPAIDLSPMTLSLVRSNGALEEYVARIDPSDADAVVLIRETGGVAQTPSGLPFTRLLDAGSMICQDGSIRVSAGYYNGSESVLVADPRSIVDLQFSQGCIADRFVLLRSDGSLTGVPSGDRIAPADWGPITGIVGIWALTADGQVRQLFCPPVAEHQPPPAPPPGTRYSQIGWRSVGNLWDAVALRSDGRIFSTWGGTAPIAPEGETVTKVSYPYALTDRGSIIKWEGVGFAPPTLPPGQFFTDVCGADYAAYGRRSDGAWMSWGLGFYSSGVIPAAPPGYALTEIRNSIAVFDKVDPLPDADGDGWPDALDNCAAIRNPMQDDCDHDGIGDACDSGGDINGNGVLDNCECIADLYVDGVVNGADLGALLAYWGPTTSSAASQRADLNRDGAVDGIDLGYLLSRWGPCTN